MLRFVFACVALVAVASDAHAQMGDTFPNGAELTWPRVYIRDANEELVEPPDPETFRKRLNLASCACSQANAGDTDLYYELQMSMVSGLNPTGTIFVGSQCEDDLQRDMLCREVGTMGDLDALASGVNNAVVRFYDLVNASDDLEGMPCRAANNGDAFVWIVADTNEDADPDFFSQRPIDLDKFMDVNGFDTQPPPLVEARTASGTEEAIELRWEIPLSNGTDIYGFHALCMDANGQPLRADPGKVLYSTTATVCNLPQEFSLEATEVPSDEGTLVDPPAAFRNLDPAYICATLENGTATSITIEGLENNAEYTVALVVVDFYGNAVGTYFNRTVVPKPVTDFWEDLQGRGGGIEGGFCASSSPSSLAGVLLVLGVLVLRKRRVIAPVIALALFLPSAARADDITPYWEDPSSEVVDDPTPKWRAGVRVGPYVPAIDDQVGRNMTTGLGPYAAMFGNYYTRGANGEIVPHDSHVYQVLPMLDVDRIIWGLSGQVTIGGSIGYMQKSGFAYAEDDNPDDDIENSPDEVFRIRSTAAENTFRLVPLALTVSYRATQLDDLYGIPIVPYIRGGLSYYIWWAKGPNGDVSKVCKDGSMNTDTCDANKAYGGSFGLQGSIGASIRAERIDADTARSMVNSGLYHAGFYIEYMFAKVDGFGSSSKLSVGDNTWFAGIDFEF
jgi:hypothetical protein